MVTRLATAFGGASLGWKLVDPELGPIKKDWDGDPNYLALDVHLCNRLSHFSCESETWPSRNPNSTHLSGQAAMNCAAAWTHPSTRTTEMIVVVRNAPHDRPGFLVGHLIGNCASFLCTKAPMLRIPETNFLHGITSISGRDVQAIFCAVATSR